MWNWWMSIALCFSREESRVFISAVVTGEEKKLETPTVVYSLINLSVLRFLTSISLFLNLMSMSF